MSDDLIHLSHQTVFLPTERQWTSLILGMNALQPNDLRGLSSELTHFGKADIELAFLRPSSINWTSFAKALTTVCTEDTDRSDGGDC